ncbi:MAG: hypothetical protein H3C54_04050 [Taibaiella sp.]|nr:hypothetical protein [Taibaiella sp.]
MTRLICLLLLISATKVKAQDKTTLPVAMAVADYQLPVGTQSVYTIQYSIQLADRVMPDSTVFTDTIPSKSKECNYTFNEQGFLVVMQVDSFDEKGKVITSTVTRYGYGKEGRLRGVVHYEDGKMTDSVYVGYNRRDEADEQVYYDKKGRKEGRVQYFYRNGRVFNVKVRDEDDMLLSFIRYEYDAASNVREKEIKGNTLQYESAIRYSYDTLANGYVQINEYDYAGAYKIMGMLGKVLDTSGRVVEITVADSNKRVVASSTFEYNDKGLPISELTFTMYKHDYSYLYEYDDNGWWKTRRKFEEGIPISKTHRVVELYKDTASRID